MGTRSLSGTVVRKILISHPRSLAVFASSRSGFTATGWPTASSMGRSVIESE